MSVGVHVDTSETRTFERDVLFNWLTSQVGFRTQGQPDVSTCTALPRGGAPFGGRPTRSVGQAHQKAWVQVESVVYPFHNQILKPGVVQKLGSKLLLHRPHLGQLKLPLQAPRLDVRGAG